MQADVENSALELVEGSPAASLLARAVAFDPLARHVALGQLPENGGVFALFAEEAHAEPYLAKASHLRRRLQRFLSPAPSQSRRLQLASRIRRIEYTETGSDFASDLVYCQAARKLEQQASAKSSARGRDTASRLRLRPAAFLKLGMRNAYPRAYVSTKPARNLLFPEDEPIGPFPSRLAAERYLEQVLDLFQLRRCVENLAPDPAFPGCIYSEMKKCLAPCNQGCTDARYAEEAIAVRDFLRTRGQSLLEQIARERAHAAEKLEFEQAAALHQRYEKVQAVAAQMPEAARPLGALSGMLVQPGSSIDHVDLFALTAGQLQGPVPYATLGMRLHNELSGSSSLYTQPMALAPVPLEEAGHAGKETPARTQKDLLEARLDEALASIETARQTAATLSDSLSLFTRWFFRPQTRRIGEVVFVDQEGKLPRKALLRAISRVAAAAQIGAPAPGAKPAQWHA